MLLNGFANSNAASNPGLVVSQIEHQQVLLVAKHGRNVQSTFLSELAVGHVQVGERFVRTDSLRENAGASTADLVVVKDQLSKESLVSK